MGERADFWLPSGPMLVRIPAEAVLRIDAEQDYVRVHTAERSFLLRERLSRIAAGRCDDMFVRIHRSTIVAVSDIAGLAHLGNGAWAAALRSGGRAAIGRSYLSALRARLGIRHASRLPATRSEREAGSTM